MISSSADFFFFFSFDWAELWEDSFRFTDAAFPTVFRALGPKELMGRGTVLLTKTVQRRRLYIMCKRNNTEDICYMVSLEQISQNYKGRVYHLQDREQRENMEPFLSPHLQLVPLYQCGWVTGDSIGFRVGATRVWSYFCWDLEQLTFLSLISSHINGGSNVTQL